MRRPIWPALSIAALFALMGLPFLNLAGLHDDASYELACFYGCGAPAFKAKMFHHWEPVMVIQYLGALKAWLYQPILKWFTLTPFVLRLPFLFAGAASVWLFFAILDRVSGRRAAIAGALLLTTDASFLLATCYDFGPVALLHLFLLAGIFLLLRFEETRDSKYLALAFFLFGLGLWHKALFVWMLGGLGAATLAVFPRRVVALITPARVALAALCFCVGAYPLIYYNKVTKGATLRTGNVMEGAAPFSQKLLHLKITLDSSVLFGWLTEDLQPETVVAPAGVAGKLSVGLADATGNLRSNWMLYAFAASCLLVPWLWFTPARRKALVALIYLAVAWGLMVALPNTGAALHHVILLWPFPHFLIAVAGAQAYDRFAKYGARAALTIVLAALVGCNALVVDHYYADLVTHGTTVIWTDAVDPLFRYLSSLEGQRVVTVDWGYEATLCLLSKGKMPMQDISYALLNPSPSDVTSIRSLMERPDAVFVDHMPDGAQFEGVSERLERIAAEGGYVKRVIRIIRDRNGRARFEISRYAESGRAS